jgi:hypothetical protein
MSYLKSCRWFDCGKYLFYKLCSVSPIKLHLQSSNLQLTLATLHIQYINIIPWIITNEWLLVENTLCKMTINLKKKHIPYNVQSLQYFKQNLPQSNHRQLFKYDIVIPILRQCKKIILLNCEKVLKTA